MIATLFINPNKKKNFSSFNNRLPWGSQSDFDRAQKRGLTQHEYLKRVKEVEEAITHLTYNVGDRVWPHSIKMFNSNGKAIIRGICRHYDDYGDAEWKSGSPWLIQASWEDTPQEVFNCTINYLQSTPPEGLTVC